MKKSAPIILLICFSLLVAPFVRLIQAEPLGDLTRDSDVMTYDSVIYPVFTIDLPEASPPWTEIQFRASVCNFKPGFRLATGGSDVALFMPRNANTQTTTGIIYDEMGGDGVCEWNGTLWEITGGTYDGQTSAGTQDFPWGATIPENGYSTWSNGYSAQKEYFVYSTCTTGVPNLPLWGTGVHDGDPWLYFSIQSGEGGQEAGVPGDSEVNVTRLKWDYSNALTSQIMAGANPARTVMFQPSRSALGASEWMKKNHKSLIWVYSFESVAQFDQLPNGQRLWNNMSPTEWREERITLNPLD